MENNNNHITGAGLTSNIKPIDISKEMKTSFLSYAMSVIVSRALPDVRDGLKPVHRRILFGMNDLGVYSDKPYKKSARIVGDVMGKYHPHGDSSIYEAMVRMSQDFSYRYELVDGHGNFGSIDGDGAAAMRYTEARMSKITMEILRDLGKDTVDFVDNYDGSEREPDVLPAKFPNLLVNGATGIAVGMATNIPPHNLGEVIDGLLALIDNSDITPLELMEYIKGPDFPTGGQILGLEGIKKAYETGNGSIIVRAKARIELSKNNRESIIITEIPYQLNKARLIDKIALLAKEKKVDGIVDLRDESNRKGMRIVIDVRRDASALIILNNLYKYTSLQTTFGVNMIALVGKQPKTITLKDALVHYLAHQIEVLTRRTQFDLNKAEARIHILKGLLIALDNIDAIIEIIKRSMTTEEARNKLMEEFSLSEIQAKSILDMRLNRLTGLERDKIQGEHDGLENTINSLKYILNNEDKKLEIIVDDLTEIKRKFSDDRRTEINLVDISNIDDEALIPEEDVIVTVTNRGYVKRIPIEEYKSQNRGGVGKTGAKTYEDDFVENIIFTSTHHYLLFFTNKGKVYKMKGYTIPQTSRTAKGLPIVNLINLDKDEELSAIIPVKDFETENQFLFFATTNGLIKRTALKEYVSVRQNGKIAINLKDEDSLLGVRVTTGDKEIILGASNGKSIRFSEDSIRQLGRTASGVRGMRLNDDEYLVGMTIADTVKNEILAITENGYGKRTSSDEYRLQTRGGKGVKALNITEKNGKLVKLRSVNGDEDLMIVTDKGMIIRMDVAAVSKSGRTTQGVRLIRLTKGHKVKNIALVPKEEKEEVVEENQIENID